MKYRYYITDLFDGQIKGTNSEEKALNVASSCDYFVVDTETGLWLTEDGTEEPVIEFVS